MFCKSCNDLMSYINGTNGGYYSCRKCGNVVLSGGNGK